MKPTKVNMYKLEGYAVTVEIEGDLKEYADSFLHIFNNVRENRELLKVKNYSNSNDVTVYCEPDAKCKLVQYLNAFGKVKNVEKIMVYQVEEPDYDIDNYIDAVIVPEVN